MMRKETEHGIRQERLGRLKNPRWQRVSQNRAAEKIDSLTGQVGSISPAQMELLLQPDKDDAQTSHRPPQIRRKKIQTHERLATDLTCDEADVDELLSAGEGT